MSAADTSLDENRKRAEKVAAEARLNPRSPYARELVLLLGVLLVAGASPLGQASETGLGISGEWSGAAVNSEGGDDP
jgi:hypothetical protein